MAKVRIPETLIPQFKILCTTFAKTLQQKHDIRLRGNVLLNAVSRAAGHDSYTALIIDAKTYGEGRIDWSNLPERLAQPLSQSLGTTPADCLSSLKCSLPTKADAELNATHENSKVGNLIAADVDPSIGELYAGRRRASLFVAMEGFLARHVATQARLDYLLLSFDDLRRLAQAVHRCIPIENGILERDLEGWIIDNGDSLGIICPTHIAKRLMPALRIKNESIRDIDLAFRRSSLEHLSDNLLFHNRARGLSIALAYTFVEQHPDIHSCYVLAQRILDITTLNDLQTLLRSTSSTGHHQRFLESFLKSYAGTDSCENEFSRHQNNHFSMIYEYAHLILKSDYLRFSSPS